MAKKKNKNNSKIEDSDKSLLGQNSIFTPIFGIF